MKKDSSGTTDIGFVRSTDASTADEEVKTTPPVRYPLNVRLSLEARERVRDAAYAARCSERAFVERWAMTLPEPQAH